MRRWKTGAAARISERPGQTIKSEELEQGSSDGCYKMNTEVMMSIGSDIDSSSGALIINMTELKDSAESAVEGARTCAFMCMYSKTSYIPDTVMNSIEDAVCVGPQVT